ncbi:MAG: hypothetical protein K2I16_03095 [Muribaculaceae bacterium]|nr:hypothetical protein [Muribaculaceae bacterium]MDE5712598.1 hypothetical protein [Muribaculaceae bacterium]
MSRVLPNLRRSLPGISLHPALETNFYYLAENGDTLVQNQKIVMKPDFSLYYVNIKYNSRTSPETGEKIVSTFQFKD